MKIKYVYFRKKIKYVYFTNMVYVYINIYRSFFEFNFIYIYIYIYICGVKGSRDPNPSDIKSKAHAEE